MTTGTARSPPLKLAILTFFSMWLGFPTFFSMWFAA